MLAKANRLSPPCLEAGPEEDGALNKLLLEVGVEDAEADLVSDEEDGEAAANKLEEPPLKRLDPEDNDVVEVDDEEDVDDGVDGVIDKDDDDDDAGADVVEDGVVLTELSKLSVPKMELDELPVVLASASFLLAVWDEAEMTELSVPAEEEGSAVLGNSIGGCLSPLSDFPLLSAEDAGDVENENPTLVDDPPPDVRAAPRDPDTSFVAALVLVFSFLISALSFLSLDGKPLKDSVLALKVTLLGDVELVSGVLLLFRADLSCEAI